MTSSWSCHILYVKQTFRWEISKLVTHFVVLLNSDESILASNDTNYWESIQKQKQLFTLPTKLTLFLKTWWFGPWSGPLFMGPTWWLFLSTFWLQFRSPKKGQERTKNICGQCFFWTWKSFAMSLSSQVQTIKIPMGFLVFNCFCCNFLSLKRS